MNAGKYLGLKVLITIDGEDVAPRFDQTTEVMIGRIQNQELLADENTVVLSQASPEDLCHIVLTERIGVVVCGGIEEEYFQYLTWKKVEVIDSVIGPWPAAVRRLSAGVLNSGDILFEKPAR